MKDKSRIKTKFDIHMRDKLMALAGASKSIQEMATEVGVSVHTLKLWMAKTGVAKSGADFTGFNDGINDAWDIANDLVESALLRAALAGNYRAQAFWLKNRRPTVWRDRHQIQFENIEDMEFVDEAEQQEEKDEHQETEDLKSQEEINNW